LAVGGRGRIVGRVELERGLGAEDVVSGRFVDWQVSGMFFNPTMSKKLKSGCVFISVVLSRSHGDFRFQIYLFFDQHIQCSLLIQVIQNLAPLESNMINGIGHSITMNPCSFRG